MFSTHHLSGVVTRFWALFWIPKESDIAVSEFDKLSDEEIISCLKTFDFESHVLSSAPSHGPALLPPVYLFTEDTVVKCVSCMETAVEPYMMRMVSSQTSIPVPKVRRQIFSGDSLYIFMEYIDGDDLKVVWPSLSLWGKLRVAWTLRGYVRQLRQVELPHPNVPGPFDGAGKALQCNGHYFTEYGAGPFSSYAEMSAWYTKKRRVAIALERQWADIHKIPFTSKDLSFDDTVPLVFTHGDVSLNNVRVGRDGTIWLIDWAFAGAYPVFFEYSCIMAYDNVFRGTPKSWLRLAPLIAGRHHFHFEFLKSIGSALSPAIAEPLEFFSLCLVSLVAAVSHCLKVCIFGVCFLNAEYIAELRHSAALKLIPLAVLAVLMKRAHAPAHHTCKGNEPAPPYERDDYRMRYPTNCGISQQVRVPNVDPDCGITHVPTKDFHTQAISKTTTFLTALAPDNCDHGRPSADSPSANGVSNEGIGMLNSSLLYIEANAGRSRTLSRILTLSEPPPNPPPANPNTNKSMSTMMPLECSFLQSLLEHLPSLAPFTLLTQASYARIQDGVWLGRTYSCWRRDYCESLVRVMGAQGSHHLKIRSMDGTAALHVVLTALLTAGLLGVKQGRSPPMTKLRASMVRSASFIKLTMPGITTALSASKKNEAQVLVPSAPAPASTPTNLPIIEVGVKGLPRLSPPSRAEITPMLKYGNPASRQILASLFSNPDSSSSDAQPISEDEHGLAYDDYFRQLEAVDDGRRAVGEPEDRQPEPEDVEPQPSRDRSESPISGGHAQTLSLKWARTDDEEAEDRLAIAKKPINPTLFTFGQGGGDSLDAELRLTLDLKSNYVRDVKFVKSEIASQPDLPDVPPSV
ncbi:hypothetical protein EW146_g4769 [Bondarzewia mesenterica]|uniref:Aminoglycoside phosphotransferase domain-containing protein n=1 Tax=Bondarzewia mesenterica TaxID=1095465 RepID=A0A4S4LZ92_9AGAM|nr:hypothetical protein EW146_g4769 [Bondarzewia mesenterica]